MSLDVGRYHLSSAHKALLQHWDETCRRWHDPVRDELAKKHLEPLAPLVTKTLGAIDRLAVLVAQVRRDCGENV